MSRSQLSIDLGEFLGYQAPIPTDAFLLSIRSRAPHTRRPRYSDADTDNGHSILASWPDPVVAPVGVSRRHRPREPPCESSEDLEAQRRALVGRSRCHNTSNSRAADAEETVDGNPEASTLPPDDDDARVERRAGPRRRLEPNRLQLTRAFSEAQVVERQQQQQQLITTLTSRLDEMDDRFQAQVRELSSKLEAVDVSVGDKYESIYRKISETMNTRASEVLRLEQELKALKASSSEDLKSCCDTIIACRADVAKLEGRLEGVLSRPAPSSVGAELFSSSTPAPKSGAFTTGLSSSLPPSAAAAVPTTEASSSFPTSSPTASSTGGGSTFSFGASATSFGGFGANPQDTKATGGVGPVSAVSGAPKTTADSTNPSDASLPAKAPGFGNPFGAKAGDAGASTAPFSLGGSANVNSTSTANVQRDPSNTSAISSSTSAFGGASSGFPAASSATPSAGEAKPSAVGGEATAGSQGAAAQAPSSTSTNGFSFLGKPATAPAHSNNAATNGFGMPSAPSTASSASPFSLSTGGPTAASGVTHGNPFMPTAVDSSMPKSSPFGGAVASHQAASPVNGGPSAGMSSPTTTVTSFGVGHSTAPGLGEGAQNKDGGASSVFGTGGGFPASTSAPAGASPATFSFGAASTQMLNVPSAASMSGAGGSSVSSAAPTFGSPSGGAVPLFGGSTGGGSGGSGDKNKMGGSGGAFGGSSFPPPPPAGVFPSSTQTPASTSFTATFTAGSGAPPSTGTVASSFGGLTTGGPSNTFSFGGASATTTTTTTQGSTGAPNANMSPPNHVGNGIVGSGFNANANMTVFGASAPSKTLPANPFSGAGSTAGASGTSTMLSSGVTSSAFGSSTGHQGIGNSAFGTGGNNSATGAGVVFGGAPTNTSVPTFGSNMAGAGGPPPSAFGGAKPAFAQPLGSSPAFGSGSGSTMGRASGSSQGTSILGSSSSRKKTARRY